jgi:hypothetical protein
MSTLMLSLKQYDIMRCIKAVTPPFIFKKLARPLFLAFSRTQKSSPLIHFAAAEAIVGQSKPLFERCHPPSPLYWSLIATTRISTFKLPWAAEQRFP